ncbi:hypothetical protein BC835DRAFT_116644 [Cytidiella melzeri]|nr:hypothetical protein BC835DRAFT_116644 [Cytidiella melzeri]
MTRLWVQNPQTTDSAARRFRGSLTKTLSVPSLEPWKHTIPHKASIIILDERSMLVYSRCQDPPSHTAVATSISRDPRLAYERRQRPTLVLTGCPAYSPQVRANDRSRGYSNVVTPVRHHTRKCVVIDCMCSRILAQSMIGTAFQARCDEKKGFGFGMVLQESMSD